MTFLFPILLIVASAGALLYLVGKRWRELSLLDIDTIPGVQETKKKDAYLKKKLDERAERGKATVYDRFGAPILQIFTAFQKKFRLYVGRVEREVFGIVAPAPAQEVHEEDEHEKDDDVVSEDVKDEDALDVSEKEQHGAQEEVVLGDNVQSIDALLKKANGARSQGEWEAAERTYIAALGVDPKNVEAYRGLADVYASQEQYEEAKETYQFLLQLAPNEDVVHVKLAELAQVQGNIEEAIEQYQQAVLINPQLASRFAMLAKLLQSIEQYDAGLEAIRQAVDLEPENLTYLDNYVDLAILVSSKKLAEEIVQRIRMVNPEYPKLDTINARIAELQE